MTSPAPVVLRAYRSWVATLPTLSGVASLLLRLYLAPVLFSAGFNKWQSFEDTVAWFGNPDWGLGLPFPEVMAFLAAWLEMLGGVGLLLGLAVRWLTVPLMVIMLVAALSVHWENGWFAIAPATPATSTARVLAEVGIPAARRSLENSEGVSLRLERARGLLQEHGHYDWLTERGGFVVLNNGIEFAATYFVMLLALLCLGGGRWTSLDDWLHRWLDRRWPA